jgi:chloramphenicol 3-O-phosphotransferase
MMEKAYAIISCRAESRMSIPIVHRSASTGLILVVVGAVVHSNAVLAAAVVILAATLILVGVASLAVEVTGYRREHRPGRTPPRSSSGGRG